MWKSLILGSRTWDRDGCELGAAVSCCKLYHSAWLCFLSVPWAIRIPGAIHQHSPQKHGGLQYLLMAGAPSPENQSNGSSTEELGVATAPYYHQNPKAVDFPCILKLWSPQWGTGLGSCCVSFNVQSHLVQDAMPKGGKHLTDSFPSLPSFFFYIRLERSSGSGQTEASSSPAVCCHLETGR